ncbi:hypothetical protein DFH06DRAFT_1325400 [Mycena polygramma]|nr:hypothetical protein DFH06DRAFT_1325400 [Mycena polygramma]
MFIYCFVILVKRSKGQRTPWQASFIIPRLRRRLMNTIISRYLLAGICTQFVLATAHAILAFSAGIHAFNTVTSTPALLISTWISPLGTYTAIQQIIYAINDFFGDLILIWRVYVVYGDNLYITIFPTVLALAAEACNIYGAVTPIANPAVVLRTNHKASYTLTNVVTAGFSMTAATQILVTTLLAVKIYTTTLAIGDLSKSSQRYTGIMWMLVESGAAMAAMDIIFLGVWRNDLRGLAQLSLGILGQLCVLVPLSIIARVGLRRNFTSGSTSQTAGISQASSLAALQFARGPGRSTASNGEGTLNLSEYKGGVWSQENDLSTSDSV